MPLHKGTSKQPTTQIFYSTYFADMKKGLMIQKLLRRANSFCAKTAILVGKILQKSWFYIWSSDKIEKG